MTRKECLEQAMGCVLKDRNNQYGGPEDSFERIADLWEAYLHAPISALDVAMMMSLLKIARAKANPAHADSFVDLAGYAACAAECAEGKPAPKADEESKFRRGDKVQFRDEIPSTSEPHWFDGTYVERLPTGGHAVSFGPRGHVIHCSDKEIRHVPKAEGCEELEDEGEEERRDHEFLEGVFAPYAEKKPEFKRGDKVQVYYPSIEEWRDATYVSFCQMSRDCWRHEVEFASGGRRYVPREQIRPTPKAEGREELVQKDLADECGGCLYRLAADAPQTPEETCQRIVDSNPATYERPRKPTGEELAEMAEEERA